MLSPQPRKSAMSDFALRELIIPGEVLEAKNTQEFIRFWVADGIDHVTLNVGGFEDNSEEPYLWGSILADIARHAVIGMQSKDPSRGNPSAMMNLLIEGFNDRLEQKADITGELGGNKNAH